jgi:transposase
MARTSFQGESRWDGCHPGINIVSRDRGGGYGEAAAKALPNAIQVADRWHLMENASAAFLDAVCRSMSRIRTAIGATTINPKLLTCAEKLRYQGFLRRQDSHAAIAALISDVCRSRRSSAAQDLVATAAANWRDGRRIRLR